MRRLGLVPTLLGYRASWLVADVIAGLTLAAIAFPEQMATARLAGVAPVLGLYAFVAGSLAIAIFGTTRALSVGADSTIAPILAAGAATAAAAGTIRNRDTLVLISLLVGVAVTIAGLARLGWIANFLSIPVVRGMLAGIAVEIVVRQLPAALGLPTESGSTVERIRVVARHLHAVNGWTIAITVASLLIVIVADRIDRRLPGALIALVASTLVVGLGHLARHGVHVVGALHAKVPHVGVSGVHGLDAGKIAATTFTVAFVIVMQTAATTHQAGSATGTTGSLNRDLTGVGIGSLLSGLVGSFAVNSSPPRTTVAHDAGGRSQATGLVAAVAVLVALVAASGTTRDLPTATLAAILLFVAGRLIRLPLLRAIMRFNRIEAALAAATTLTVALVGIEQGVLVAIVLSLAYRTRLASRPRDVVLAREVGTDHWVVSQTAKTERVPGVLVYYVGGPLWFGDAQFVADRVRHEIDVATAPVHWFVLDATAMSDVDYTGALVFESLVADLRNREIAIAVARANPQVHHAFDSQVDDVPYFSNVEDAVRALTTPDAS